MQTVIFHHEKEAAVPLKKTYTKVDVQAALDLAEGHKFSSFQSVWGGNDSHYVRKEHRDKSGTLRKVTENHVPGDERERISSDEAHTKRNHVKGFQEPQYVGNKSRYADLLTCLEATAEVLNSPKGQAALQEMDDDSTIREKKINGDVVGAWYGDKGDGIAKKIKHISLIIMRLGEDTLWLHTSYPKEFIT